MALPQQASAKLRRGARNGITELLHAEGATYIRLGGHHVRHRPTFLTNALVNIWKNWPNWVVSANVLTCLKEIR